MKAKSPLWPHLALLAAAVRGGNHGETTFPAMCTWLRERRVELSHSLREVEEAAALFEKVRQMLCTFQAAACPDPHGRSDSQCLVAEVGGSSSNTWWTARSRLGVRRAQGELCLWSPPWPPLSRGSSSPCTGRQTRLRELSKEGLVQRGVRRHSGMPRIGASVVKLG